MYIIQRAFAVSAAFALTLGLSSLLAQEAGAPQHEQQTQAHEREGEAQVEGELLSVDPDAQTFAIRTEEPRLDPGIGDPGQPEAEPQQPGVGDPQGQRDDPAAGAPAATMQFRYDDQTEVTGELDSAAGLATAMGAHLTVHYEKDEPGAAQPDQDPAGQQDQPGQLDQPGQEGFGQDRAPAEEIHLATRIEVHSVGDQPGAPDEPGVPDEPGAPGTY